MCHHEKEKVKERRKYRTKKIPITPLQVLESLPQLGGRGNAVDPSIKILDLRR